jgi:16S rRNA (guanine1207-N2)-methyltransferase
MDRISEILRRNIGALGDGPVHLLNPPRDTLPIELSRGRPLRISSQDFGDYRWFEAATLAARFEVTPELGEYSLTTVLILPREKRRLEMMLHAIAHRMPADSRLLLAGENKAGIKSAQKYLQRRFGQVRKLDSARHCCLFEARKPLPSGPFQLSDYEENWEHRFAGKKLQMVSLPGVFAHGRLDRGSSLLLQALETARPTGRILDFACGSGVLGLSLLAQDPQIELTLLDSSALAIESARRSLAANGMNALLLPSDGLSEVDERYDWIISNPPFHRGVDNDLDIAAVFFRKAGTFLNEKGRILVVFNRHLPYLAWLEGEFSKVKLIAGTTEFSVVQATP